MNNYSEINKLKNVKSVCIIGHLDPDSDALSSMVVFKHFLQNHLNVRNVDLFADTNRISEDCQSILNGEIINPPLNNYNVAIALDSTTLERLGKYQETFLNAQKRFVIDHHKTNTNYGDINIIENSSSTCEIIYSILKAYKYKLTNRDRELIYSGIITDTNNFTTPSLTERTFSTVSEIIEHIDHVSIYENFFAKFSIKNMKLFAKSIENVISLENEKILITYLTKEDLIKENADHNDLVGIVNRIATISGNLLTCFIHPKENNMYVSLRAKKGYDVAQIAKKFNGGGHTGASGFITKLNIEETINIIKQEFIAEIKK